MLSKTGFGATALVRETMTRNIVTVEHDDDLAMGCNTLQFLPYFTMKK